MDEIDLEMLESRRKRIAELEARIESVGELLAENGCDCDCEHDHDEHDADCERCLACHIEAALFSKDANCIHCGYPENCHEDNPLFKEHAYKVRT